MSIDDVYEDWEDYCYECGGYGDDYSEDENWDLVSNCADCPHNSWNDYWDD